MYWSAACVLQHALARAGAHAHRHTHLYVYTHTHAHTNTHTHMHHLVHKVQALEALALSEAVAEEIEDGTKPDIQGMQSASSQVLAFKVLILVSEGTH